MKFIIVVAVLCFFCVQGSLQQFSGSNYGQGCMQGRGGEGCSNCNMQGCGGCGISSNPEILLTLYKIMFHLTTTTTTTTAPQWTVPTTSTTTASTTTTSTSTSTTTTSTTTTTTCSPLPASLVTLYQLYKSSMNDHFYTSTSSEADSAVTTYGYTKLNSPGLVALSQNCSCGVASLVPTYRLYGSNDHFYTTSKAEADYAVTIGYKREGIAWYCSPQMDLCGATLALYRYINNGDHNYVTNSSQGEGTFEGITCYMWPD
ncbi:integumentary mucin C.1-like [Bradysia coprophila]|uniref:integumentary mucin C.1-like n=1 Tax=Bradysia coprophila TaxID=38358 RepID=UPI00187DCA49|nr:integumentary mucin C.1-like [Bradysia coprophila]